MTTSDPTNDTERAHEVAATAQMTTAIFAVLLFGALFAIGAFFVSSGRTAFSILVGAVMAAGNLYALTRIVRAFTGESSGNAGLWAVLALAKMLVLFGGAWILMTRHAVDPIPLAIGFGALPLGIALGSIRRA